MKPRKPLPRPTKPLRRSRITTKPTKRKQAIDEKMFEAKTFYFLKGDKFEAPCQKCQRTFPFDGLTPHHKIKRSLRGGHEKTNLIMLCQDCHAWAHDGFRPENLKAIRDSEANAENGYPV